MQTLTPAEVVRRERQRKKFPQESLEELTESILREGLIHPPSFRDDPDGTKNILVAGDRRTQACEWLISVGEAIPHGDQIFDGCFPITHLGTLTDEEAFRLELHENIKRLDLTWQERVAAEDAIADLLKADHAAASLPPPTVSQIATAVKAATLGAAEGSPAQARGGEITNVATSLALANFLDDPEVAKAKTRGEAEKILKKKFEAKRIAVLAQEFQATTNGAIPHRLLRGDFRDSMKEISDGTIDCILTDPPYGIGADEFGDQSSTGHNYGDSESYFLELINPLAEESFRVARDQAHAYVFCDPRRFPDLAAAFSIAGWWVWPIPLIWDKGNGMLPLPEYAPRRTYECIMFAAKGRRPVRCVKGDVLRYGQDKDLKHGAQKPVALYRDLLSRSVVPGNTVLDPFAGSGTIYPAATAEHVIAIGCELDEHNANLCAVRMAGTADAEDDNLAGLENL